MTHQESPYLTFELHDRSPSGVTKVYFVFGTSKNTPAIGTVKWYGPWRKYAMFPNAGTIWDANCLDEAALFCREMTNEHKNPSK